MVKRVALIDKAPSRTNYKQYIEFDFDHFHMSDVATKKLLKKDITLEFDPEPYDLIILVGSEAAKTYVKVTSVTNMAGQLVNDKYVCITNPAVLIFKPEGKQDFQRSIDRVNKIYTGTANTIPNGDFDGIDNTEEAEDYLLDVLENAKEIVAWDTETTALYPRDGYVLGVSITYKEHQGRYILTDCLSEYCIELLQKIADKFITIFHNLKFDWKMLEYHLGIKFDGKRVHDTMLMHYVLDENTSHSLKNLALKYTDYGDYDSELDTFKKEYCKSHNILQEDFTYDLIPYDIMKQYACLTHDSKVFMEDGSLRTIGELCRAKSTEKVLSYNISGNYIEPKRITGWVKQKHSSQEWVSLVLRIGCQEIKKGGGVYKGPRFTPDHNIFIKDKGWTAVSDIVPGDRIITQERDLTEDAYQILYGSMLGDGRFDSRNSAGSGFMISQAEQRKNYVAFKAKALGCTTYKKITQTLDNQTDLHQYSSVYNYKYSDMHNELTIMRDNSYNQNKPYLSKEFCNLIDLKAVAIWYMDDGNLANNTTPRIWSRSTSSIERFNMLERLSAIGLVGARFYETEGTKSNAFFTWDFKNEERENFFKAIAPYMHEDCMYKIPAQYHGIDKYTWNTVCDSFYYATIVNKVPWVPGKRGYATKWCINVEDNHNFFTTIGLVHNCIDTSTTYTLYHKFWPLIVSNPKLLWVYENLLLEGTLFLNRMEEVGIPFSLERLQAADKYLDREIIKATEHIYTFPEVALFEKMKDIIFNPNSVIQLRELLFDFIGLSPTGKKTATGAVSTDAEVLKELTEQHELPASILAVRQLTKLRNTYVSKIIPAIDRDGRVRTNFNLIFTTSGRLSSSGKFNAQQIPRDNPIIKGCIVAPEGYVIVSQDLQTGEMYYAAVLSNDKNLQQVFKSGGDFHSAIAHSVFNLACLIEDVKALFVEMRQSAKAISFGILYGSGAPKVAESVSKATKQNYSVHQAQDDINAYFAKFSRLKAWLKERKAFIEANGFTYSFFGRKRRLINVFSTDKGIASHEVRSGINAEVQSLCSDINLLAAIETDKYCRSNNIDARIFMLVHDSIVAQVKIEDVEVYCKVLKENTQKDRGCSIPGTPIGVDTDVGKDYAFGKYEKYYEEIYEPEGHKLADIQIRPKNSDS